MSSQTAVFAPIVSALVASEEILGKNRKWEPRNQEQKLFIEKYFSQRESLSKLSSSELRNWVSRVASELNQVLTKEGFAIKLPDFEENEFGVVSILDVTVSWLLEGQRHKVYNEASDTVFDAVKMKQFGQTESGDPLVAFSVLSSTNHEYPVARLNTTSGDGVFVTIANKPRSGFELLDAVAEIKNGINDYYGEVKAHLIFPMIDLDQEVDIGWIVGLQTFDQANVKTVVKKALQQTKFKMNEKGARVKSAVAMTMVSLSVGFDDDMIIDKPFFLWIERSGLSVPILSAYLDIETWKDPKGLEM